jgi:hypothetical protein
VHCVARVDQERNFRSARNHFSEDFYLFCDEISWHHARKTRHVATRMRQALDKADRDGLAYSHEYNWNGGGCRFQSYRCLRPAGNYQIGS